MQQIQIRDKKEEKKIVKLRQEKYKMMGKTHIQTKSKPIKLQDKEKINTDQKKQHLHKNSMKKS